VNAEAFTLTMEAIIGITMTVAGMKLMKDFRNAGRKIIE